MAGLRGFSCGVSRGRGNRECWFIWGPGLAVSLASRRRLRQGCRGNKRAHLYSRKTSGVSCIRPSVSTAVRLLDMRIRKDSYYAVVTGDIVGSSQLSLGRRANLPRIILRGSNELRSRFPGLIPTDVEIFRGDSWQFVVSQPSRSLRASLFFRAFLRSQFKHRDIDTRIAIGIGNIWFIPKGQPAVGDGEAFRLSGLALDKMGRSRRMAFGAPANLARLDVETVNVLLQLIDVLAKGWTDRQAYAVCGKLLDWSQVKISTQWFRRSASQQAVAQHLDRAGWNAIHAALVLFERSAREYDRPASVKT